MKLGPKRKSKQAVQEVIFLASRRKPSFPCIAAANIYHKEEEEKRASVHLSAREVDYFCNAAACGKHPNPQPPLGFPNPNYPNLLW